MSQYPPQNQGYYGPPHPNGQYGAYPPPQQQVRSQVFSHLDRLFTSDHRCTTVLQRKVLRRKRRKTEAV
ncbi:hypothetical protein K491DRAFT_698160 [Lophiostoma macrostomum CBS 122681]|uniref:Uncharacterized protein n=1 Tax=Lophiostoma macrostomum CBS 122681 TaxID=1314788 RepID=A0A6A6SQW1_9PLEO|nr:hypothetical protein K491DRAFT_698160 [Lophiostoma macrostomum CBS 122681]